MVDLAAHTLAPYVRLRPRVGLKWDWRAVRTWVYVGAATVNYRADLSEVWGGKIQYQLTDRNAVYVEGSNEKATSLSVGVNWCW